MLDSPCVISPSADTLSPGRIKIRSFTFRDEAATSCCLPSESILMAFLGIRFVNALMPARARSAATLSNSSPTENKKTTAAASSASPIIRAPIAATDINISIEKGVPVLANAHAVRTKGVTPIITASAKTQVP